MSNLHHEALTALLSGITTRKNTKEIWWKDENGNPITIEGTGEDSWVVRRYYKNGQRHWKANYHQGQIHGKYIRWHPNGQKYWETNYHQDQLHGKDIRWDINGKKRWETDYHQGQLHGKCIEWSKDGQKYWDKKYEHGKESK